MICAGIDAGSRTIKIVLWDTERRTVIASGCVDQGVDQDALATTLLEELTARANIQLSDIKASVATGYGRNIVTMADRTVTEITCHAHGVQHQSPDTRTVIDIGGQDSKVLWLSAKGGVSDFQMNDRCAAGTGRFLEVVAQRLNIPLDHIGHVAAHSTDPVTISSMCVVFAETEIVGLLASGKPPADIVAGVLQSIARRVVAMIGQRADEPIVFAGGVAMVPGMREVLSTQLGRTVNCAMTPHMTGALGAALLAASGT